MSKDIVEITAIDEWEDGWAFNFTINGIPMAGFADPSCINCRLFDRNATIFVPRSMVKRMLDTLFQHVMTWGKIGTVHIKV